MAILEEVGPTIFYLRPARSVPLFNVSDMLTMARMVPFLNDRLFFASGRQNSGLWMIL